MKPLQEALLKCMKERGWNQLKTAMEVGISAPGVWAICSGRTVYLSKRTEIKLQARLPEIDWRGLCLHPCSIKAHPNCPKCDKPRTQWGEMTEAQARLTICPVCQNAYRRQQWRDAHPRVERPVKVKAEAPPRVPRIPKPKVKARCPKPPPPGLRLKRAVSNAISLHNLAGPKVEIGLVVVPPGMTITKCDSAVPLEHRGRDYYGTSITSLDR